MKADNPGQIEPDGNRQRFQPLPSRCDRPWQRGLRWRMAAPGGRQPDVLRLRGLEGKRNGVE